jgi:predicted SAM-dependent methyltransferase
MQRHEFIADNTNAGMFGLEIGPGYAPSFPKSQGWNVETLDHATAEGLREKYEGETETSSIEHIDYVTDGRPIDEIIPRRKAYDFIYASHVIEHIPDPIRFFQSCNALLKPEGKLLLVVPDKRRCFDALRSLTSAGDFLNAYYNADRHHTPGNAFDFYANGESDWKGRMEFFQPIDRALELFRTAEKSGNYVDIHAWRFTPTSFRLILRDLADIGMIELREIVTVPTNRFEFYVAAGPQAGAMAESRMALYEAMAREQIEGLQQLLA